ARRRSQRTRSARGDRADHHTGRSAGVRRRPLGLGARDRGEAARADDRCTAQPRAGGAQVTGRPMRIDRRDLLRLIALAPAWSLPEPGFGENFPLRPVRMVVPFAGGGPADITGRIVAQHLSELLGQQVYVDNRVGAGGVVGAETVVRAAPDGHTLLFSSNTAFSVTPAIKKNLSFDLKKDIAV